MWKWDKERAGKIDEHEEESQTLWDVRSADDASVFWRSKGGLQRMTTVIVMVRVALELTVSETKDGEIRV